MVRRVQIYYTPTRANNIKKMKQPMAEIITETHTCMTVIFSHITNGLHKNSYR